MNMYNNSSSPRTCALYAQHMFSYHETTRLCQTMSNIIGEIYIRMFCQLHSVFTRSTNFAEIVWTNTCNYYSDCLISEGEFVPYIRAWIQYRDNSQLQMLARGRYIFASSMAFSSPS
jgi:hypothetical protein